MQCSMECSISSSICRGNGDGRHALFIKRVYTHDCTCSYKRLRFVDYRHGGGMQYLGSMFLSIDMCVDMSMDMCMDMCAVCGHVCGHVYRYRHS